MVLVAALLVLVAVGLLVAGVVQGEPALQWGAFAASALATVLIGIGALRRRSAPPERAADRPADHSPVREAAPPPAEAGPSSSEAWPPPSEAGPPPVVLPPRLGSTSLARLARPDDDEPVRRVSLPPVPPSSPMLPRVGGPTSQGDARYASPAEQAPMVGEPPAEDVEFADLLLIMDLTDEVLVVDEHPRYHVAGCPRLAGVPTIPIPMLQARTDGFTPCGICTPDRAMAQRERARRG
ncbi:hypothetical protein [Modestobacter sp. SYSU DS0290]